MSLVVNDLDFDIDEKDDVCCLLTISQTRIFKHFKNQWRSREIFWNRFFCQNRKRISYFEIIHKLIWEQFDRGVRRVFQARLNQWCSIDSFSLRIFDEQESESDFYNLIRSFELFICLRMINREHEQLRTQFAKYDFLKFWYKHEISIWDDFLRNISICYEQSIKQRLCSVESCSCELFENYCDFLECFASYD
jgi:hypothetical protein